MESQFDHLELFEPPLPDVEYTISPYIRSQGLTLLIKLVLIGRQHPEVIPKIRELAQIPSQLNGRCLTGATPLMVAGSNTNTVSTEEICQILIEAGADLNLQNDLGYTALMIACRHSKTISTEHTARMLINANKLNAGKLNAGSESTGAGLDYRNIYGNTALMLASRYSNSDSTEETVRMLIAAEANLNVQNNLGETALIMACRHSRSESTVETVRMLINAGANPDLQDHLGATALIRAVLNSSNAEEIVRMLLTARADLNLQTNFGQTALMVACEYSNTLSTEGVVRMLIDSEAINLNLQDRSGYTALSNACQHFRGDSTEGTVQMLIEAGADPNLRANDDTTALFWICQNMNLDLLALLLNHGAYLDELILDDALSNREIRKILLRYYHRHPTIKRQRV